MHPVRRSASSPGFARSVAVLLTVTLLTAAGLQRLSREAWGIGEDSAQGFNSRSPCLRIVGDTADSHISSLGLEDHLVAGRDADFVPYCLWDYDLALDANLMGHTISIT